jgi:hypothetical protein
LRISRHGAICRQERKEGVLAAKAAAERQGSFSGEKDSWCFGVFGDLRDPWKRGKG